MSMELVQPHLSRYSRIIDRFHEIEDSISFEILDGNQFYFVFPDDVISESLKKKVFGCDPLDFHEIKSCSLARLMFLRSNHEFQDCRHQRKILIDFEPLGGARPPMPEPEWSGGDPAGGQEAPGPGPGPLPEVGALFSIIEASQDALEIISRINPEPTELPAELSLEVSGVGQMSSPQADLAAKRVSDDFLNSLSSFSEIISSSQEMPADLWRAKVRDRLMEVIRSLTETYELSGQAHQDKLSELEHFRLSIDDYLKMLDPLKDSGDILKLGACVNSLLLDSRQHNLHRKIEKTDSEIDHVFRTAEREILDLIPRGAITPEVPRVQAKRSNGASVRLSLSFIHLMIAARLGGLSVRIDFSRVRHLAAEYAGSAHYDYPRLHLCNQSRFKSFARLPLG